MRSCQSTETAQKRRFTVVIANYGNLFVDVDVAVADVVTLRVIKRG